MMKAAAMLRQAAMMAAAAMMLVAVGAAAAPPKPDIVIAKPGSQCVAAPEEMRRNHMDMLKHQRDRTMRKGIRGEAASLNECISCHAGASSRTVLGKGGFCQECHSYAAVKLDCWDCHQPKVSEVRRAAGVKQ